MMLIHISLHLIAGFTFPAESSTIPLITSTKSTQSHTTKKTSWITKTLTKPSTPGSTLKTTSNLELTSNINSNNATSKHMSTDVTKGFATETYTSIDSTTNAATRIMENVTFNNTMPPSISHPNVTPVENQSSVPSSTTANQINLTRRTTESEFTSTAAAGTTKSSYNLAVIAYCLWTQIFAYLSCDTWYPIIWYLTSAYSDKPVQPPVKLSNIKWWSVCYTSWIFKRQTKALIRLPIWAGWSEALLVAHTTLFEIPCHGLFYICCEVV